MGIVWGRLAQGCQGARQISAKTAKRARLLFRQFVVKRGDWWFGSHSTTLPSSELVCKMGQNKRGGMNRPFRGDGGQGLRTAGRAAAIVAFETGTVADQRKIATFWAAFAFIAADAGGRNLLA